MVKKLERLTLNQQGIAHYLVPVLVILLFAVGGAYYLVASHADSVNTTAPVVSSTIDHVNFFNYANAASAPGVQQAYLNVPQLPQSSSAVDIVGAGYTLTYKQGAAALTQIKKACFYVRVIQGGISGTTATVKFTDPNNSVTKTLALSTNPNYQSVCLNHGNQTNPNYFTVANVSSRGEANIAVYQAAVYIP